ncbi:zinc finger protein 169 [Echeneis naucrates]|uniref:C2H2-type domain-containing protein n=1 Tax=Echeneis naucrates TaxID=173247 RepID=A0A665UV86_ECHNA|nr:zinc finger protein 169 [Echeneis naucrates]XP_029362654.1 zinc finger protein 169 [Echeneis naucrates]
MDGVSWSTSRAPESFTRSRTAADTLSRLASFIAQADNKHHTRSQRQRPSHLPMNVCPECGEGFPYVTDLLHHQDLKHTLPKPHRCPSCGQEFILKSSLQLHQCDQNSSPCELCHSESRLGSPCPACTTHTLDPSRPLDKSLHRQPHLLGRSPYACAPCGRGFSQKQALLHHQQAGCSEPPSPTDTTEASSLPDDSPPVSEGDSPCSNYSDTPGPSSRAASVCRFCPRSFRSEVGLQRHEHINHADERLMALQGQKVKRECTSGQIRKRENNSVAGDHNVRPKCKKKLLSCRSCDMVFRSTSKLYVHRKEKHSREKNMIRDSMPAINKRRRSDSYPCQVCGKVFFHHLSLRAHYRQHTVSSSATIKDKAQSQECTTKDNTLSENQPNKSKTSPADDKTVRAGPGRPRKVARLETKVSDTGRCKEVPEVLEEEEEEEERDFPCPSCAEVFPLQSQLKEHMELHQSSMKSRQCSVCTHMIDSCKWRSSKRQRLYHCVPCQQGFSALDSFLEHCQEHLRVRVEEDNMTEGYIQQASKA